MVVHSIIHPSSPQTRLLPRRDDNEHTCPSLAPLQCFFPFESNQIVTYSGSARTRLGNFPFGRRLLHPVSRVTTEPLRSYHPPSPRARLYRRRRRRLTSTSYTQTYIGFTTSMSHAPFKCKYQVSLYPSSALSVTYPISALSPRPSLIYVAHPLVSPTKHPQTAPQSLLAPAEPGSPSHPSQLSKTSLATIYLPSLGFACFNVVADPPSLPSHHHLHHVPRAKPLIGLPRRQGGIDIDNHAQPFSKGFFPLPCGWAQYYPAGPLCTMGRSPASMLHYCTVRQIAPFLSF